MIIIFTPIKVTMKSTYLAPLQELQQKVQELDCDSSDGETVPGADVPPQVCPVLCTITYQNTVRSVERTYVNICDL